MVLKWAENTSQFNEDFIENYNEGSDERYFLEVDVHYLKNLHDLQNDLPFSSEKMKTEHVQRLIANTIEKKMSYT